MQIKIDTFAEMPKDTGIEPILLVLKSFKTGCKKK